MRMLGTQGNRCGLRPYSSGTEEKNILVVALQGLGNVLLATPLFHVLRTGFPCSKLFVLILRNRVYEALRLNPDIDELIMLGARRRDLLSDLRSLWKLWRQRFDIAVVAFPGGIRSAMITFLSGAKVRVGYPLDKLSFRMGDFLYTHKLSLQEPRHDLERNLKLADALGLTISPSDKELSLSVSKEDQDFANKYLCQHGVMDTDIVFGFHPGGGSLMDFKRWPVEKFAELGSRLNKDYKAKVILFEGPDEQGLSIKVASTMNSKPLIVKGVSLMRTAALIGMCDIFISNDSGLMHMAVAMKVPTVGIFGPTDPRRTAPYGQLHRIVRRNLQCSPCFRFEESGVKCASLSCLRDIDIDAVLSAIKDILPLRRQRSTRSRSDNFKTGLSRHKRNCG